MTDIIAWSGGENPAPGKRVRVKLYGMAELHPMPVLSSRMDWRWVWNPDRTGPTRGDIIAYCEVDPG